MAELARLELLYDRVWHPLQVRILHGESRCNDVAVLIPQQKDKVLAAGIDSLPWTSSFFLGQDAYFLGFPYGLAAQFDKLHITIPLIKHAYVSAMVPCSEFDPALPADEKFMLLDGFNNAGFSGGPVVSRDQSDPQRAFKILAVIHGYRADNTPLSVNGQRTPNASVETNTGIILAVPFEQALKS